MTPENYNPNRDVPLDILEAEQIIRLTKERDELRKALQWIRGHIEKAKSEDDINIDKIHDKANTEKKTP